MTVVSRPMNGTSFASSAESGADSKSVTYKSKATGETYMGTYVVGSTISDKDYLWTPLRLPDLTSGDVLTGIVSTDDTDSNAEGPVSEIVDPQNMLLIVKRTL